ncbi:hypothetical protein PP707_07900, partial [Acetobacter pasteurianus]|nr:hypothetical protein [Acetobacter pasteurianus]
MAAASASANGKVQLSYKEVVLQEVASLAIVLLCSLIPIIIGSYSTVTKPKNARDPRDDKHVNSNYDPLDMDDLRYLIANMTNLEMIDFAALDMKMVLLMPVFAAVALLGMYYCLQNGVNLEKLIRWYMFAFAPVSFYITMDGLMSMGARNISHWFGKDSNWIFKRLRLAVLDDVDAFPKGEVQNVAK